MTTISLNGFSGVGFVVLGGCAAVQNQLVIYFYQCECDCVEERECVYCEE